MKIAFIVSQFPCYDEAFILRELYALSKKTELVIFSLKPSKDPVVHDQAKELLTNTVYVPFLFSWKIHAGNGNGHNQPAATLALAIANIIGRTPIFIVA